MSKYAVKFARTAYVDFEVEAESEEQAEEKAFDLLEEGWEHGDISGELDEWNFHEVCQPDQPEYCGSNYTMRVRGRLEGIAHFFGLVREHVNIGEASLGLLHEDGDTVLATIEGLCYDSSLNDTIKHIYPGAGSYGFALALSLEVEAFADGQRDTDDYREDYCEHLHVSDAGELIALEQEVVSDIIELNDDETVEEMLEEYGYDPDDQEEVVELRDGVFALGCSIGMYQWSKELSE